MSIYKIPIKELEEFQKKIFFDSNYFHIAQINNITKYEVGFPSLEDISNTNLNAKFFPNIAPKTLTTLKSLTDIVEIYVGIGKEKHSNILINTFNELLALTGIKNNIYGFIEIPNIPKKYNKHNLDEQILKYELNDSKNKTINDVFIPHTITDYDYPTLQDFIANYDEYFNEDEILSCKSADSFQKRY